MGFVNTTTDRPARGRLLKTARHAAAAMFAAVLAASGVACSEQQMADGAKIVGDYLNLRNSWLGPHEVGRFDKAQPFGQARFVQLPILNQIDVVDDPVDHWANAQDPTAADLVPEKSEYRLGVGDTIAVSVYELVSPGVTYEKAMPIPETGKINIQNLGAVEVTDKTPSQLEAEIVKLIQDKRILDTPQVTVSLLASRARIFSMLGAVSQPGTYNIISNDFRLLDALALARDIQVQPGMDYLFVIRQASYGEKPVKAGTTAPATGAATETGTRPAASSPSGSILGTVEGLNTTNPATTPAPATAPATTPTPSMTEVGTSGTGLLDIGLVRTGDVPARVTDRVRQIHAQRAAAVAAEQAKAAEHPAQVANVMVAADPTLPRTVPVANSDLDAALNSTTTPTTVPTVPAATAAAPSTEPVAATAPATQPATTVAATEPATTPATATAPATTVASGDPELDAAAGGGASGQYAFVEGKRVLVSGNTTRPAGALPGIPGALPGTGATPTTDMAAGVSIPTQRVIRIPIQALREGVSRYNIVIRPGDVINIPTAEPGEFYLMGHVGRPGVYSLTGRKVTLRQAIAAAGNLDSLAVPRRCELIRRVGTDQEVIVQVNLQAIFDGETPDIFLKPNDTLNVGTDLFASFLAVTRNAYRASYGWGFVYDKNLDEDSDNR